MSLEALRSPVKDALEAVDHLILEQLHTDVALVGQLGNHIIHSGGKRLRPLVSLLAAQSCGYERYDHIALAAIIEFIHTATLLHDDVVDKSGLRRGKQTANAIWGNQASVLVGDFLYSRSFQMMVSLGNMTVMQMLANTTNAIAEGEVLQLINVNEVNTDEQKYFDVINRKTAALFEAATALGGVIAGAKQAQVDALATYGYELGVAYQLVDDILDYQGDEAATGKHIGDDLAEGKTTLPLIWTLQQIEGVEKEQLLKVITEKDMTQLPFIQTTIEKAGGINYTKTRAAEHLNRARLALEDFPDTAYKKALIDITHFVFDRQS